MTINLTLNEIIKQEGNHYEFTHKGFQCIVDRKQHGALCGYVILPKGHRYYGKSYDDIPVDVHGGLTFAEEVKGGTEGYIIGFDCCHCFDIIPNMILPTFPLAADGTEATYKTMDYVITECKMLADQLETIELSLSDLR